jgi:signal transduction histidine kinase
MKKILFSILLLYLCAYSRGQTKAIDSLKQLLLTAKDDTNKVILLASLSNRYNFSFADTAVMYAQQGLQLARKINFDREEAFCLMVLGSALTTLGTYSNALDFLYQSISLADKTQNMAVLALAYGWLGLCYRELDDFEKAKFRMRESMRLAELFRPQTLTLGQSQGMMSSIFEKNNELDSALFYANKSYATKNIWSGLLVELGAIHRKLGHDSLALDFYRRAVPMAMVANFQIDIIDSYNGISQIHWRQKEYDSAVIYAKLALSQQWGRTYPIGMFRASGMLATIYGSLNKNDSTLKYLKLNIALKDSLFNQQKTRDAQNFEFAQQLRQQDLAAQEEKSQSRIRMLALGSAVLILLVTGFSLWRNNRQKQKANILLLLQKEKVESTLAELKSTQAQLIQSEKMASLGEITSGIAHEIQNPLNFINNFAQVNEEFIEEAEDAIEKGQPDEALKLLRSLKDNQKKINLHGQRADSIVKSMLQHSRSSTGQKDPTNINALADEYLRLAYHGFRAKDKSFDATMKTDFDQNIGSIKIVPQDIGRVLLNLYNNAFYALSEKKKQVLDRYEPRISVTTKELNGKVVISVKDNGNGIPQKVIDKIFQPFFTTKPAGQGTGLGLSLSYDIIKAHGGEIKVNTKEGEGSEFIIQLQQ